MTILVAKNNDRNLLLKDFRCELMSKFVFLTIPLVVIRIRIIFFHFVPSSTQLGSKKFLVTYMQLNKPICRSVGQLVDWSVDWPVGLSVGWSISR